MPRRLILPLALLLCTAAARAADLPFLHPLFADHMVLQRDVSAPVWGWTTPGAEVKVSLAGQTVAATADDKGRWFARLAPLPAGGPYWMTVNGPQVRFLEDVLVGDVWLCSGQSNMEMGIGAIGAPQDIAAAANPKLRLFMADHRVAGEPQPLVGGTWKPCNPQSVTEGGWAGFSAVGYFFGRHVQQALDIPVGLIQTCWGGTVAEAWVSGEALRTMPDFAGTVDGFRAQLRSPDTFEAQMAEYWKQHDPGTSASPAWSDPAFDDVAWKTMPLPNAWENAGLPGFEGLVWFRKSVDLPADWAGQDLVLHLGPVDDRDTTYFNGTPVGGLDEWNLPRDYRVPGSLVKAGRNVIAVRVLDTGGAGGLYGQAGDLRLERPGQAALALAGDWRYRDSTPMSGLPGPPQRFGNDPNLVTVLYNGMVAPLVPFGVRGAIWYQGESNAARPKQYRTLLPTLIRDWRSRFGVGEFPFLIVQLANFMAVRPEPSESGWAELREAQFHTTQVMEKVGIALAIDIGDAGDVHPRNKQEVGRRLGLAAEAVAYGREVECSGPVCRGMKVEGGSVRLRFDHAGGGLAVRGDKLQGFAVCGADRKWVWAEARVDGDCVVASSPQVLAPVAVRYGWADNPIANLYNRAGLPAVPFRTDGPE